jgi:hypothetical protein
MLPDALWQKTESVRRYATFQPGDLVKVTQKALTGEQTTFTAHALGTFAGRDGWWLTTGPGEHVYVPDEPGFDGVQSCEVVGHEFVENPICRERRKWSERMWLNRHENESIGLMDSRDLGRTPKNICMAGGLSDPRVAPRVYRGRSGWWLQGKPKSPYDGPFPTALAAYHHWKCWKRGEEDRWCILRPGPASMRVVALIPPNLHPLRGAVLHYAKQLADGIGVLEFTEIDCEPPIILTTEQALEIASRAALGKLNRWYYERNKLDGITECGDAEGWRHGWGCLLEECQQIAFDCPPGVLYVKRGRLIHNLIKIIQCERGANRSEMAAVLTPLKDCSEPLNLAPELRRGH